VDKGAFRQTFILMLHHDYILPKIQ